MSLTSISTLLQSVSPAAIFWAVTFVIIFSFDRKGGPQSINSLWPSSHIGEKCGIRVPSVANRDSSSSIIFPAWMLRIVASLSHAFPNKIFRGIALSVQKVGIFFSFTLFQASTTLSYSFKLCGTYCDKCATLAPAYPCWFVRGIIWASTFHNEQSEHSAGQIIKAHDMEYIPYLRCGQ